MHYCIALLLWGSWSRQSFHPLFLYFYLCTLAGLVWQISKKKIPQKVIIFLKAKYFSIRCSCKMQIFCSRLGARTLHPEEVLKTCRIWLIAFNPIFLYREIQKGCISIEIIWVFFRPKKSPRIMVNNEPRTTLKFCWKTLKIPGALNTGPILDLNSSLWSCILRHQPIRLGRV